MLYRILRTLFPIFFRLLFRAKVAGLENMPKEGPVILAANHMSNWDPPFLACFLPRTVSYMAKQELFENPIFSAAIRSCYAFPVKRGAADLNAIKTAIQLLKDGHCLALFPEGTRSATGDVGRAEAGVGLIAARTRAPVVPAAISGTNLIFSGKKLLPTLSLRYGEPVYFKGNAKNKEDLEAFSQSILDEITKMKKMQEEENK